MKEKLKSILRKAVFIGALTVSPLVQDIKAQGLSLDISSTFASRYVSSSGFIIGNGSVNQSFANLNIGKHLSASVWTSYDFKDDALHERDIYLNANTSQLNLDSILKGKVSGSISLQNWSYPSGLLGKDDDYAFEAGLHYRGKIDADLKLMHVLTSGLTWDRNRVILDLSKYFEVAKLDDKTKIYLNPSLRTAYHDNFFGERGFAHVTPGFSIGMSKTPINLELFAKEQIGLSKNIKDQFYFGVSVGVNIK